MGQLVTEENLPAQKGVNNETINISNLAPGIYHYVLITDNNKYAGKLVKQ
jgi:hypothetical protein